jgi:RNA-directed DNA polymerase
MHGHEKSGDAIVAVKPTNKAERSAAEPVERRAEAKGNAGRQSTHRAQYRVRVAQALASITAHNRRRYPRWEPYAGKLHVRICAGGAQ